MTTRKRLLLSAATMVSLVGVALLVLVLAILPPRPGVAKANYDRVQIGMTEAEVEAIFGGPGKDLPLGMKGWIAPDGAWAAIEFVDGRVVDNLRFDHARETTLDKIRRWLARAW